MMAIAGVKYERHLDGYNVIWNGTRIGFVRRYECRYNLRRLIVIRGWRATTVKGQKLYSATGTTADTRDDAARALIKGLV